MAENKLIHSKKPWLPWLLILSSIVANRANAQIVPDNTLGSERSQVTPLDALTDRIDGGAQRGTNLFHSFQDFNIDIGRAAYFANPAAVQNILSRVTGSNPSHLFGTLGVLGDANLYFLNPNGILFGPNARLDLRGSFLASTADRFVFPDGSEFSALNPQAPPLLMVDVQPPVRLEFERTQPAAITSSGHLVAGKDLTLAAGNLDLSGQLWAGGDLTLQAQDTIRIRDSIAAPFVAAAGGQMLVQGDRVIDVFALGHADSGFFSGGDMVLRSANQVGGDAHYWSGGHFNIEQLDGSPGDLFSPHDPVIRSQGDVSFNIYFGTSLHILAGGQVDIGTVIITGTDAQADTINPTATPTLANVALSDGTPLVINGNAKPTLDIRAGMEQAAIGGPLGTSGANFPMDIFLNTFGFPIFPPPTNNPVATSADITIGEVSINPPNGLVFLSNQYQPNLSLPGGDITLTGVGLGIGGIDASAPGGGQGSDVIIDARRDINLLPNSFMSSAADVGDAGDIHLLANRGISLTGASFIDSDTLGPGKGGDLKITTRLLSLSQGSQLSASTQGAGTGGNLIVNALEKVELIGTAPGGNFPSGLFAFALDAGNAGSITIDTQQLVVRDGAEISASNLQQGNSGDVTINASELIHVIGDSVLGKPSGIFAQANPGSTGEAGNLTLNTKQLRVQDGGQVSVSAFSSGASGNLTVNASEAVHMTGRTDNGEFGSRISANTEGTGRGGKLAINTQHLVIRDGSRVSAGTFNAGSGQSLTINASESVQLIGASADNRFISGIFTQTSSSGDAASLTINTKQLLAQEGASVSSSTFGIGSGGQLTVNAAESVRLIGTTSDGQTASGLFADTAGLGEAGDLVVRTNYLLVQDGARAATSTDGQGNAGNLVIEAAEVVQLIGESSDGRLSSGLFTDTDGSGKAGDLAIRTKHLLVEDGGQVATGTFGEGNGGLLTIDASEAVQLKGESSNGQRPSGLFTDSRGAGNAGDMMINTKNLLVQDGARAATATLGSGAGGMLTVNASEQVQLDGQSADGQFSGGLFTESRGPGNAGDLKIGTKKLLVQNGAVASAATFDSGAGGTLTVNATESVQVRGGFLTTLTRGSGNAGNLTIHTRQLFAEDEAEISASTAGQGNGGNLELRVLDGMTLNRSGLFANTAPGSTGNGGNIFASAGTMLLQDRAAVAVDSQGAGTGGNIEMRSNSLTLDNQAFISAETASTQGGNIALAVRDVLLMRRNSSISTTAGTAQAGGDGGNITITASFVVAVPLENSDITANAFEGDGGQVFITANGIFGLGFRPRLTPLSDITASSEFGTAGTVTLNTLEVDPSRGLANLPNDPVNTRVSAGCQGEGGQGTVALYDIGRGGLPPSPEDLLRGEAITAEWIEGRDGIAIPSPSVEDGSNWGGEIDEQELATEEVFALPLDNRDRSLVASSRAASSWFYPRCQRVEKSTERSVNPQY